MVLQQSKLKRRPLKKHEAIPDTLPYSLTPHTGVSSSAGQHPQNRTPVEVQPVAGHIQAHAELEEKGGARVQQRQVDQQTHGGAAVRQHVQHGPKPSP